MLANLCGEGGDNCLNGRAWGGGRPPRRKVGKNNDTSEEIAPSGKSFDHVKGTSLKHKKECSEGETSRGGTKSSLAFTSDVYRIPRL